MLLIRLGWWRIFVAICERRRLVLLSESFTLIELLLAGLALMLVFEGVLPFVAPQLWKDTFRRILTLPDAQLRIAGLCSMLVGLVMLYWIT